MEDLMTIQTPWMKSIVAKLLKKLIRSNLGINLDIAPGDLTARIKDGRLTGHICLDFGVDLDELTKSKAARLLEEQK